MAEPRPPDALRTLVGFGRELRRRGLPVGTDRIVTFCRCVGLLVPADREAVYWSARSALLSRREDMEVFDAAFERYFGSPTVSSAPEPWDLRPLGEPTPIDDGPDDHAAGDGALGDGSSIRGGGAEDEGAGGAAGLVASGTEVLRAKSFAEMDDAERRRAARLIRELAMRMPSRSTRRLRSSPHGSRVDVARTLRRSLRTQGEPFHRSWRIPGRRTRPLVVLVDVSGSMALE